MAVCCSWAAIWRETRVAGLVGCSPGAHLPGGVDEGAYGRAEVLAGPVPSGSVVCRRTAAWLYGLDVLPPGAMRWPVECMVGPGESPPRRFGCRGYRSEFTPAEITGLGRVQVTTPERTALDCARWLPRLEAVAAVDQFLRAGVDLAELGVRAEALAGRPGVRRLRQVIALADPGAVLPGESWTRTRIVEAGLPRPRTQLPVSRADGRPFRLDLGYEAYPVGIEYDGENHHTTQGDRTRDEARRRWLRTQGWDIITVTKSDVLHTPAPFLTALLTALQDHGWPPDDTTLTKFTTHLAHLRRPRHR